MCSSYQLLLLEEGTVLVFDGTKAWLEPWVSNSGLYQVASGHCFTSHMHIRVSTLGVVQQLFRDFFPKLNKSVMLICTRLWRTQLYCSHGYCQRLFYKRLGSAAIEVCIFNHKASLYVAC
jgi:hypothetical protein